MRSVASCTERSAACSRISFFASRTCSSISRRVCSSRRSRSAAAAAAMRCLFGLDVFGAARAQRVQLAGQRLQLLFDRGELRGRRRFQLRGFDEILADRRAAAGEIFLERLVDEVIEDADEDDEVGDRPHHAPDHSADALVVMLAVGLRVIAVGFVHVLRARRGNRGGRLFLSGKSGGSKLSKTAANKAVRSLLFNSQAARNVDGALSIFLLLV